MVNTEFDGRFRIEAEIYKNDRAWVYRGVDLETGQGVAVKVLRPWTASSEKLESRFSQEFKVLKTLEHPHIVKVLQTGLTPTRFHYFAMELLNGQTLAERLRVQFRLPPTKVAEYLEQLASAVDSAHDRGIVHRDLNPNNVMLHRDPPTGREVVKILDFGLAKIVAEGQQRDGGLTAAGVSVGTPTYMSPEQAMGLPVDHLSDIYSLGIMLFTLLTGHVPYVRPTDYATMVAHVSEPIPWFSERGAAGAASASVEAVVRRAMAKEPKDRPQSATELARVFRAAVDNPDAAPAIRSGGRSPVRAGAVVNSSAGLNAIPSPEASAPHASGLNSNPLTEAASGPAASASPITSSAMALSSSGGQWLIPVLVLLGAGLIASAIYLALR